MHILFVCLGNICRTPMAEGLLRQRLEGLAVERVVVSSAGTAGWEGAGAHHHTQSVMDEIGIDVSRHTGRELTRGQVADADLILTMSVDQRDAIGSEGTEIASKTFTLKEFLILATGDATAKPRASQYGPDVEQRLSALMRHAHRSRSTLRSRGSSSRYGEDRLEVADPMGADIAAYRRCRDELHELIEELVRVLEFTPVANVGSPIAERRRKAASNARIEGEGR